MTLKKTIDGDQVIRIVQVKLDKVQPVLLIGIHIIYQLLVPIQ